MKILIANRGEIACRVMHTLRDMAIPSVAVYSEVDREAPHVWLADEAINLEETMCYLNGRLIIETAQRVGATAIHPGYGFLSQNAEFARMCREAGIVFIGPSPEAMIALGDKRGSRQTAEREGVPVIPGAVACETADDVRTAADKVGYPILIKAAGGGGGKGMRRVDSAEEVDEAFAGARREAESSFADDRMLVEKYIHPARHVEVQILGDGKDAVAFGERECSLQRRYQKIIEESPSPGINETTRQGLFESATKLARAVGYQNAGTVEFLVGPDGSFYFLEVNSRLQVEHPVTEQRFGSDLVRAQVEVAHGGPLPTPPSPRGHAMEARLNAEDPYNGFLPATGPVLMLEWPNKPFVRIDTGIHNGSVIEPHYDSLLAKIIAWGEDREQARRRLLGALKNTVLLGLTSNQSFLVDLLETDFFKTGETYTTTVEAQEWNAPEPPEEVVAAAQQALARRVEAHDTDGGPSDRYSPWLRLGAFRMSE
ncbi:MAG: hypothetical protein Kow0074_22130 [Candidatus Zixiibacteriota bacterium]